MIGCRFAIYPMSNDYIEVILAAIQEMNTDGMSVRTDALGTLLIGEEERVFDAVRRAFEQAAQRAGHVVMTLDLSRGCPGEPEGYCDAEGRPMA